MKKLLKKNNLYYIIGTIFLLFIVHFQLISKNIITADVLLNNSFYNGYSWEVSLGRFGLLILGIFKSYISIPSIDLFISYVLISLSLILIFDLFDIKSIFKRIIIILIVCISPIISATLIFNYCSVGYLLAFFLSTLSLYIYYNIDNKIIKYIIPIILLVTGLSMYQAYLSFMISIFFFYNIKLILDKKNDLKKSLPYLLIILCSVIIYFILMKLSQYVLHIDLASYSNANSIGLSTILSIPNKIIESYKLFYQFFFTNEIMKNTFLHNNILYIILGVYFIVYLIISIIRKKLDTKNIIILFILIIMIPIFLNSVIFVINDAKLQLLMSASYLMMPIFMISIIDIKKINYLFIIILCLLIRNYFIEIQATYLSLESTFNKYYIVIDKAIDINNKNNQYIVIGNISVDNSNSISNIYKYNYGYISDEGLFWDEYNLRKIGFERFCYEYFGTSLKFSSEDDYNNYLDIKSDELIINDNDLTIINLNNFNK